MNGSPEDYLLAGYGAAGGFLKYYVRPELTAKRAWAAIGLGVVAYELAAPKGELLSEGVDRSLESHKALTVASIGLVALHLCNYLPTKFDPLHQGLEFVKGL